MSRSQIKSKLSEGLHFKVSNYANIPDVDINILSQQSF